MNQFLDLSTMSTIKEVLNSINQNNIDAFINHDLSFALSAKEDHDVVQPDVFTIRSYQQQLYQQGKGTNSIIYMETGCGKTLVILMLMFHQILKFKDKKVVFLTNTIELAKQQYNQIRRKLKTIAAELGTPEECRFIKEAVKQIQLIYGGMPFNNTAKIYVMTSQVYLNLLRKGKTRMIHYSFIAFDECHAATANHPYNNILKEFYYQLKRSSQQLPVLVGATASPVINVKAEKKIVFNELIQLAINLDSNYLNYDQDLVKEYLKSAKIETVLYDCPSIEVYKFLELTPTMLDEVLKQIQFKPLFLLQKYLRESKEDPYVVEQVYEQLICRGTQVYLELGSMAFIQQLKYVQEKIKKLCPVLSQQLVQMIQLLQQSCSPESVSPKVRTLMELINPESKIIVFVTQRLIAMELCALLQSTGIKCSYIVGVNKTKGKSKARQNTIHDTLDSDDDLEEQKAKLYQFFQSKQDDQKDQNKTLFVPKKEVNNNEVLSRFIRDEFRVLIATSVAEEGLDIPMCNMVINFNLVTSTKAFIQMKGRARKEESRYVLMVPDTHQNKQKSQEYERIESYIKEGIQQLSQLGPKFEEKRKEKQEEERKKTYYEELIIESTGASINTNWSQQLIQDFTQGDCQFIVYNLPKEQFICFLKLPLKVEECIYYGDKQRNINDAKSSVAFKAAVRLYKMGYLSDDLTPMQYCCTGFHHAGAEDDDSIVPSKKYLELMKRYSATYIKQKWIGQTRLFYQQKYYLQDNCRFFITRNQLSTSVEFQFRNIEFLYICDYFPQDILNSLQDITVIRSVNVSNLGRLQEKYVHQLQDQLSLISNQDDSFYSQQSNVRIRFDHHNAYSFVVAQKDGESKSLIELILSLNQAFKVKELLGLLEKKNAPLKASIEVKFSNTVLANLDAYFQFTGVFTQGKFEERSFSQIEESNVENVTVIKRNFEEVVKEALVVANSKWQLHFLGLCAYKFIQALQTLQENCLMNENIQRNKAKAVFSKTYIKTLLIEKFEIFKYLHNPHNPYPHIPGLIQESIDQTNEDQSLETLKKINENFFYQHFSTIQIARFVYTALGIFFFNNDLEGCINFLHKFELIQYEFDIAISTTQFHPKLACFKQLEIDIGYRFRNASLLFQAVTDCSFRKYLLGGLDEIKGKCPDIISQIESSKSIKTIEFANDQLAFIGKYVWKLAIIKYLVREMRNKPYIYVKSAYNFLTQKQTLAFTAHRFDIADYMNTGNRRELDQIKEITNKMEDVSALYRIRQLAYDHEGVNQLSKAMWAIVGAIYFDCGQKLNAVENFLEIQILVDLGLDEFLKEKHIHQSNSYQLMKKVENKLGVDIENFDLIKVPGEGVNYVPYNRQTAEIVNLLDDKVFKVTELSIKADSKRRAWTQLEKYL